MQARRILGLSLVLVAIGAALALRFSQTSAAPTAVKPGDVNEERIAADAVTGVNWLVNGRTNDSKHFSPLKQINSSNVSNLGLAWYFDWLFDAGRPAAGRLRLHAAGQEQRRQQRLGPCLLQPRGLHELP